MKKIIKKLFVFSALFLFLFGCKSKPEEKPVKPAVQPPVQIEAEKIEDGKDFTERLEKAEKNAQAARQAALQVKADENYPVQFKNAENLFENAGTLKPENKEAAAEKFEEAETAYKTLVNLASASEIRREIDINSFARYSSENYAEAEKLYLNSFEHYEMDYAMAFSSSEDSLKLYRKVIEAGYTEWAKTAKTSAYEAKTDCDSIKAAKSMTKDYNSAVRSFNEANTAFSKKEYKNSFEAYNSSFKAFAKIYETVSQKRAEAEQALARAREKQNESSELALEADKEAPLSENTEGFDNTEIDPSSLEIVKKEVSEEDAEQIEDGTDDENAEQQDFEESSGDNTEEESEPVSAEGEL